ncbi:MAG: galactose-1-phosphate uridylyltransferase [Pirellulaceae bacterium]
MPEYRQNPLTREWVILSSERMARPSEFLDQPARRDIAACPFCLGNEHETPEELARYSSRGSKDGWSVRVVPNKYPAVTADPHPGPLPQGEGDCNEDCLFRTAPALGEHEVIIESPRHVVSLTDLTSAETELLFLAYRDRIAFHRAAGKARYVQAFKNVGPLAGASMEHSHSQLMALEHLPADIERDVAIAASYFRRKGRSLMGAVLEAELDAGTRVIAESATFAAFCPFASRFPYEVCIGAKTSGRSYEELQAGELGELAGIVREIIGRIERALGPVAYNYYLRPAPFDMAPAGPYDWHIEIFPRLVKVAGFEWSTGVFINTVSPEAAAETLRTCG